MGGKEPDHLLCGLWRWRNSFWFGPSPPILIIIFCLMLPETYYFQVTKAKREARHKDNVLAAEGTESRSNSLRAFWRESSKVLKQNWVLLIYMVVLRTGFDSCLHGSQDIYPTFLKDTVRMSATKTKVITVVGQTGAVLGGTTIGYLNSVTGRRLTMMCTAVAGAAIVPASSSANLGPDPSPPDRALSTGSALTHSRMDLPARQSGILSVRDHSGSHRRAVPSAVSSEWHEAARLREGHRHIHGRRLGVLMLCLFLGPEMSQEERELEAEAAMQFERLRAQRIRSAEIGASRAKGQNLAGLETEFGDRNAKGDYEKGLVAEQWADACRVGLH
ncbi:hypothetical protein LTR28_012389 [Elasticomyces elasticus]|nr:hypothetical protein LTR28_012389 [Elasticomyces elasticus]